MIENVAVGRDKHPRAPFRWQNIEESGLDYAFVGHYHRPHDGERHTYPGNPDPLSFGEDGDRGAVVFSIPDGGPIKLERYNVASSSVHDLSVDITGCSNRNDVYDRVLAMTSGLTGAARITLNGELSDQMDLVTSDIEDLRGGLDAVMVRVGDLRAPYDLHAIAAEPTVRGQFIKDVLASDLQGEARRRVLITGLRALDGRNDLEVP